jgi:HNH endonuclease
MLFQKLYEPVTTPCVITDLQLDAKGYGRGMVFCRGRWVSVRHHRHVYAEAHNLSPAEMKHLVVMHKCDNPSCINLEHLMLGTVQMNNLDKLQKGRNVTHFGPGNEFQRLGTGNARLTPDQVRAIRADPRIQVVIAKAYGITQAAVSGIKLRKLWPTLA